MRRASPRPFGRCVECKRWRKLGHDEVRFVLRPPKCWCGGDMELIPRAEEIRNRLVPLPDPPEGQGREGDDG